VLLCKRLNNVIFKPPFFKIQFVAFVKQDIMKNIYIGKIVEDYFEMRLFIIVLLMMLDSDRIIAGLILTIVIYHSAY
jgi:hypothetical protein